MARALTYKTMTWSFSFGRLWGSELRVHATFFLLLAWVAVSAWLSSGPMAAFVNVLFIVSLFACVVAHEFGHAMMARRFGIRTPDITLLPIGGVARLEKMPEKPAEEIAVAAAGPAVNVAIWAILTVILGAETHMDALQSIDDPAHGFIARLAAVNLFLVLFNMVPAFPMDGGRVLRAVLAMYLGRVRATLTAARAGQAIAFIFGLLGLASGNPVLLLIGIFVFVAAAAESSDVALRDQTHGVPARDAMITAFETLTPDDTINTASQALLRTTQAEFPVIGSDGRLIGILTRNAIMSASEQRERGQKVADAMSHDIPEVRLDASLEAALDGLGKPGVPAVAVTDRSGYFLGYITRENLGEWMILNRR